MDISYKKSNSVVIESPFGNMDSISISTKLGEVTVREDSDGNLIIFAPYNNSSLIVEARSATEFKVLFAE